MYDVDPANLDRCRDQYRLEQLETENAGLRVLLKNILDESAPNALVAADVRLAIIHKLAAIKP